MDSSGSEFQDWDWEVLDDDTFSQLHSSSFPDSSSTSFGLIEGDALSADIIRLDYFSLRNHDTYAKTALESPVSVECLVHTENLTPNDTHTGSQKRDCPTNMSELASESGDALLDDDQINKSPVKTDFDLADITKTVMRFEEATSEADHLERWESDDGKLSGFAAQGELDSAEGINSPVDSEELSGSESHEEILFLDKFHSESSSSDSVAMKSGDDRKESEIRIDQMESIDKSNEELGAEEGHSSEAKSGNVEAKRSVLWWKVPFEVLRYCFLRAGPVWSFSVAAAFMGIVILGRRLYNIKRTKSRSLQLNITVDDKKMSQFASQAARLNEAFLVVRRVPVVRAAGANTWPAMNIR